MQAIYLTHVPCGYLTTVKHCAQYHCLAFTGLCFLCELRLFESGCHFCPYSQSLIPYFVFLPPLDIGRGILFLLHPTSPRKYFLLCSRLFVCSLNTLITFLVVSLAAPSLSGSLTLVVWSANNVLYIDFLGFFVELVFYLLHTSILRYIRDVFSVICSFVLRLSLSTDSRGGTNRRRWTSFPQSSLWYPLRS